MRTVRRAATLTAVLQIEPELITDSVAEAWATLRELLRDAGGRCPWRSMPVNDSWIAATAIALGIPVVTQDDDYFDIGDLTVVFV